MSHRPPGEPFLLKSRSAHPERRVVVFETWRALKTEHGDRCGRGTPLIVHNYRRWKFILTTCNSGWTIFRTGSVVWWSSRLWSGVSVGSAKRRPSHTLTSCFVACQLAVRACLRMMAHTARTNKRVLRHLCTRLCDFMLCFEWQRFYFFGLLSSLKTVFWLISGQQSHTNVSQHASNAENRHNRTEYVFDRIFFSSVFFVLSEKHRFLCQEEKHRSRV